MRPPWEAPPQLTDWKQQNWCDLMPWLYFAKVIYATLRNSGFCLRGPVIWHNSYLVYLLVFFKVYSTGVLTMLNWTQLREIEATSGQVQPRCHPKGGIDAQAPAPASRDVLHGLRQVLPLVAHDVRHNHLRRIRQITHHTIRMCESQFVLLAICSNYYTCNWGYIGVDFF